MHTLDPIRCALFLTVAFVLAGLAQSFWLSSPWSRRLFGAPLDGGRSWGGARILGDNKTHRGFIGMIMATGVSFFLVRLATDCLSVREASGLWPLGAREYGLLGCWVGLGFMGGELPNSFVKRRLHIPPGGAPSRPWARAICFFVDRIDSIVGGLLALAIAVRVPALTCAIILVVGPGFHWAFNVLLYQWGVKPRPA